MTMNSNPIVFAENSAKKGKKVRTMQSVTFEHRRSFNIIFMFHYFGIHHHVGHHGRLSCYYFRQSN